MGDANTEAIETLATNAAKNEKNPYAYLERDDFTSEKYKIEVRGLPKYYGIGEFKKLLNEKFDLQSCKVKPPRKSSGWLYVCFRSEECRQRAISTINGILWKNSKLTAQVFVSLLKLFFFCTKLTNSNWSFYDRWQSQHQIPLSKES